MNEYIVYDMDILNELNSQQRKAAFITEGNLRVIAGAGSGKTKLLVGRYAYLTRECGIDSANILCVTFTNKAAGEMKRRIRNAIGEGYDTSLICTYHGFCARLLRDDIDKIYYPKNFQIIDISQQKSIISAIYEKKELKMDFATFERMLHLISVAKRETDYVERMCSVKQTQILPEIVTQEDEIIEEYLEKQKETFSLDFNDLINFAIYLLQNNQEVREKWQNRLNYIQVDEFQDSSHKEMLLIDILSQKYGNLMIVGDPDQNIYEWRGSDVKLLVDFDKSHKSTESVYLNQNYRSTPQILRCANTLIEKNKFRLEKELFTDNPDGKPVFHYHEKNDYAVADRIVELIKKVKKESGWNYSNFTVLYRSSFLSRIIEEKLGENAIPYEIVGGVKFFHRMEVQDVVAYFKLIVFDDDTSFKRVINKPKRQFGRVKLQNLINAQRDGESLFKTLEKTYAKSQKLEKNLDIFAAQEAVDDKNPAQNILDFINSVKTIRRQLRNLSIHEVVEKIVSMFDYESYIRQLGDMERLDNLAEFKRIASEYEKNYGENISPTDFLNQISLQFNDEDSTDIDAVRMMTIHAAKGLEFPTVFVVGLTEGIFPSSKTIEERKQEGLEEERRLCYVAITRAEKRLFLFDAETTSEKGSPQRPSRFLFEMGEANYERIGNIPESLMNGVSSPTAFYDAGAKNDVTAAPSSAGNEIEHPIFGKGLVTGQNPKTGAYRVKFDKFDNERDISADFLRKFKQENPSPPSIAILKEKYAVKQEVKQEVTREIKQKIELDFAPELEITEEPKQEPKQKRKTSQNRSLPKGSLLNNPTFPKTGWRCVGMTDLGKYERATCELCGVNEIRYVHHMEHPEYPKTLHVGCVCAGNLEGNAEQAKERENKLKKRSARISSAVSRKWKVSAKGNFYTKIDGRNVVVFQINKRTAERPLYSYSIDETLSKEVFHDIESAKRHAVEKALG